jgi:predicted enzyme related to lactoylglutathione lyase
MIMKHITGLGGVFIRSKHPEALSAWYKEHLGLDFTNNYIVLPFTDNEGQPTAGYNVLSFFKSDSDYFAPSEKQAMLNLRVQDLAGLLEKLSEADIPLVGEPIDEEYGKFAWILDPEDNKIELWEPAG